MLFSWRSVCTLGQCYWRFNTGSTQYLQWDNCKVDWGIDRFLEEACQRTSWGTEPAVLAMTIKHISRHSFQMWHSLGICSWAQHFQFFSATPGWDLVTVYMSNAGEARLGASGHFQPLFPAVCCNPQTRLARTQRVSASTKGVGMMWPSASRAGWCGCLYRGQDWSRQGLPWFAHRTTPKGLRCFHSYILLKQNVTVQLLTA